MKKDGSSRVRREPEWDDEESRLEVQEHFKAPKTLSGYVLAIDEQHAAKIANERRIQLIANGEW